MPHGNGDQGSDPQPEPAGRATTSAVAIPLVALGLLAAAIWLGSKPAVAPDAGGTRPVAPAAASDPLPSWNDGPAKRAILDFVAAVTTEKTPTYVPPAERVAVFDHDGTLVCEKPVLHGMFLVDRIQRLVERRPELAHEEPYATLLTGDLDFVRRLGKRFFAELTFEALAGVPEERIEAEARDFLRTARHPVFDVPLGDVTYAPMKELLAFLGRKGFGVWICSGSGIHFMRPAAELWYGLGPERVIASRPMTHLRETPGDERPAGTPARPRLDLVVLPQLRVLNDEEQKPVSIGEFIGRRPILAVGNVGTTGDIEMLRWSQSDDHPSLQLLVLHDDAEREMAYGEPGNESLDAAKAHGWTVVRMASDWNRVFSKPLARRGQSSAPTSAEGEKTAARFSEEIAAYELLDAATPPAAGGVAMLGSSNIRLWNTLAEDFPGMNVLGRGVGGCRLTELAEVAPRLVAKASPQVIVISAGTNDIASGATADDVRSAFEHVVTALRPAHPDATIAFLAISPTIKRWEQRDRQDAANAAVREFVEGSSDDRLAFLDANAAFLGPDGTPAAECFLDDQQHPSTIGNARRAKILRPLLRDLLEGR
ncbi:MAG: GDSL-type esterase/lipase family protein [Pirellulales bacterium]